MRRHFRFSDFRSTFCLKFHFPPFVKTDFYKRSLNLRRPARQISVRELVYLCFLGDFSCASKHFLRQPVHVQLRQRQNRNRISIRRIKNNYRSKIRRRSGRVVLVDRIVEKIRRIVRVLAYGFCAFARVNRYFKRVSYKIIREI